MSFTKIYLHIVWATKNREPILTKEIRNKLFLHIREYSKSKNIFIDRLNGYNEHIHCLISLNSDVSVGTVVKLLKGESSHWINSEGIVKNFEWGNEYFAVSIGESQLSTLRKYIDIQEEHHKRKSFTEEYNEFLKVYRF